MGLHPSKQQETTGIQDLLNDLLFAFNDLKNDLRELWTFLDDIQQKLQETISSNAQPVLPKEEPKELFPIPTRHIAPAERKGPIHIESAVSNPHSNGDLASGSDVSKVSINEVIARFQTELTHTKKPVMDRTNLMNEKLDIFCNQMKNLLERYTPGSNYPSHETKVKGRQIEQQGPRMITNQEEGTRVSVQIYISQNANLRQDIIDSLCKLLRRGMTKKYGDGVTLQIHTCKNSIDINSTMPLIVLCPFASRLGASVSDALSEVRPDENVALLILHHVAGHDINVLSSTSKLTLPESTKLGCILDMVFHNRDGIYRCKQNDDTVVRIAEFLSEYKCK